MQIVTAFTRIPLLRATIAAKTTLPTSSALRATTTSAPGVSSGGGMTSRTGQIMWKIRGGGVIRQIGNQVIFYDLALIP